MSRLDSAIRRLLAQRACLDFAVAATAEHVGDVLELGLGNGRTYSHLRERCEGRRIWVFERSLNPHPDCRPPDDALILGDLPDSLHELAVRRAAPAVLAHLDIGSGDVAESRDRAERITAALGPWLAPDAVLVSDQPTTVSGFTELPLPPDVQSNRYFLYRYGAR